MFTRRTGPGRIRARPMNCGITAAVTVCAAYTGNSAVGATTGSFAKEAGRSDKNCCCFWKTAIHPHGPVPEHPGAGGTESGHPVRAHADSQDAIERACADLIALSEELTDRGILHDVGWWAKETQKIQTAEIRSAEDLIQALGALLGATLEERKKTIWERFSREYGENSFSQVIIIDDETAKTYNL